jgi:hypothetical protein
MWKEILAGAGPSSTPRWTNVGKADVVLKVWRQSINSLQSRAEKTFRNPAKGRPQNPATRLRPSALDARN